jgi:hypothetical protein
VLVLVLVLVLDWCWYWEYTRSMKLAPSVMPPFTRARSTRIKLRNCFITRPMQLVLRSVRWHTLQAALSRPTHPHLCCSSAAHLSIKVPPTCLALGRACPCVCVRYLGSGRAYPITYPTSHEHVSASPVHRVDCRSCHLCLCQRTPPACTAYVRVVSQVRDLPFRRSTPISYTQTYLSF